MTRKLLALAGVATIALGLAYVSWPVGHIPPYDANLVRLAESNLQGYCSGEAFWRSGGAGSARLAGDCRTRLAGKRSNKPDLMAVPAAFCAAIVKEGWEGTQPDCLSIMFDNQYWPTYDGAITAEWNRARPYPRPLISTTPGSQGNGSRTGDRNGGGRPTNPSRGDYTYP
mgnify:FL=1